MEQRALADGKASEKAVMFEKDEKERLKKEISHRMESEEAFKIQKEELEKENLRLTNDFEEMVASNLRYKAFTDERKDKLTDELTKAFDEKEASDAQVTDLKKELLEKTQLLHRHVDEMTQLPDRKVTRATDVWLQQAMRRVSKEQCLPFSRKRDVLVFEPVHLNKRDNNATTHSSNIISNSKIDATTENILAALSAEAAAGSAAARRTLKQG